MSTSEEPDTILALLRLGYTRDEIAGELDLNPRTVRRIIRSECRKRDTDTEGLRALLEAEGDRA